MDDLEGSTQYIYYFIVHEVQKKKKQTQKAAQTVSNK